MKRILLLATIITLNLQLETLNCNAQNNYVTIPDTAFVSWLKNNGYVSCMKDSLLDTTCMAVLNTKKINCSSYNIYNLSGMQYFKNLDTLICHNNNLTGLPALASSVSYFDCSFNEFATLPDNLPSSLKWLNCSTDMLTSLPVLNSPLSFLDCSFNYIANMPAFPSSLTHLDCDNNLLTSVPAFPDSLTYINISSNEGITCLPLLPPHVFTLVIYTTSIQCVLNNPNNVSSLPSCSVDNPNGCSLTGVSELQVSGFRFQVFPNPASGSFTISSSEDLNNAVVEVDNVLGEKLFDARLKTQDSRPLTLDLSGFASGIYFIRVGSAGETQVVKVVKE